MAAFLTKHYFDVVSDEGAWAIGYDIALPAAGLIGRYRELTGTGVPPSCWSLRAHSRDAPPEPEFRFEGGSAVWQGGETGHEIGFENDVLRWKLTRLRSRASVRAGDTRFAGLGYGETVTLKRPPWKLGVAELWWGRYLSRSTFLTCIVADGPSPIRFGVCGEETTADVTVDSRKVKIGGARIEIGKQERLISSGDVFGLRPRTVTLICKLLGAGGLAIHQHKAVYACRVVAAKGEETGLCLAEHVKLKRLFWRQPREAQT